MGLELNPQPAKRPRFSASAWRVFSDGMSPPQISNPLRAEQRAAAPLGTDHWQKKNRDFCFTQNDAQVFIEGGEIFPAMEDMLRKAKSSIRLDYYIFSGTEGARLAEILVERAKAGVDVRVQLDPHHGEIEMFQETEEPLISYLKANGVQVDDYPLERIVVPEKQHEHIDHNKVIVVDGQQAMVGGQNIADAFLNNHDVMVQIAGPAVKALKHEFDQVWAVKHPEAPKPPDLPTLPPSGDSQVRIVGTGIDGRRTVQSALTELLAGAKKRVYLEMFEVTSPDLVDALIAAKKRGVDVRVLTDPGDPGRFLGFPLPTGFPDLPSLYRLMGAGIQVRNYSLKPEQTEDHLKLVIVDDALVVGSANWTDSAMESNAETSLEIKGGKSFNRMLHMFADDWNTRSVPAPKPTLYRRGLQTLIDWVY